VGIAAALGEFMTGPSCPHESPPSEFRAASTRDMVRISSTATCRGDVLESGVNQTVHTLLAASSALAGLDVHFTPLEPVIIREDPRRGLESAAVFDEELGVLRALEASGGAFIGALWPVSDRAALAFARDFYEQLTSKRPIGEAVRLARLHVHEQFAEDPSWLAYSCFADPTAQFEPGHSRENSPIPSDRL
jgi:hypothetical protein